MKKLILLLTFLSLNSFGQVPTNGLVAYYPSNGNANDSSGNNYHGILQAGVVSNTDRLGNPNSALLFDGSSDSIIFDIISTINPDSIKKYIIGLQNFITRYALASNRDSVANWIKNQYMAMGFTDVAEDVFTYNGLELKNIIATLPGKNPNEIVVFGGHYDSQTIDNIIAPGADDNASGTSAVLEIARIFKAKNYKPEYTIKFINFAGEELRMIGSINYVNVSRNNGEIIRLMINEDMISYTTQPVAASNVVIEYYTQTQNKVESIMSVVAMFCPLTPLAGEVNFGSTDSWSFNNSGIPAIGFMEDVWSPYMHTAGDTIGNYNMQYCAEIIKASCAVLIKSFNTPACLQNLKLHDAGNGNTIKAEWEKSKSNNVEKYIINIGKTPNVYDTSFVTIDTVAFVTNLVEGVAYYLNVTAISTDSIRGYDNEKSITPYLKPAIPANFAITSQSQNIRLTWGRNNRELDFKGYNLYRSQIKTGTYTRLNTTNLTDTNYTDVNVVAGQYYYYIVQAIDSAGNESVKSDTLRGRIITMNQGIGIIDGTTEGDGTLMNPSRQQLDSYFAYLVSGYQVEMLNRTELGNITIADLGAYSSVIWHCDKGSDVDTIRFPKDAITNYLNLGGKILFSMYLPTKAFMGTISSINNFSTGDFIYDYLKVDSAKYQLSAKFSGAIAGLTGYNNIVIDTNKTSANFNHQLSNIQVVIPNSSAQTIYTYDSFTGTNPLKGQPVGIEYMGSDYKFVLLSYPLYYMDSIQTKQFVKYVLSQKFNEQPMSIKDEAEFSQPPMNYLLNQNYPNPFNPSTVIKYALPKAGLVSLKVYDVLGNEIETLVKEEKPAGTYKVNWNASNLPSGVYFYRIQAGNFIDTKKMLLLK